MKDLILRTLRTAKKYVRRRSVATVLAVGLTITGYEVRESFQSRDAVTGEMPEALEMPETAGEFRIALQTVEKDVDKAEPKKGLKEEKIAFSGLKNSQPVPKPVAEDKPVAEKPGKKHPENEQTKKLPKREEPNHNVPEDEIKRKHVPSEEVPAVRRNDRFGGGNFAGSEDVEYVKRIEEPRGFRKSPLDEPKPETKRLLPEAVKKAEETANSEKEAEVGEKGAFNKPVAEGEDATKEKEPAKNLRQSVKKKSGEAQTEPGKLPEANSEGNKSEDTARKLSQPEGSVEGFQKQTAKATDDAIHFQKQAAKEEKNDLQKEDAGRKRAYSIPKPTVKPLESPLGDTEKKLISVRPGAFKPSVASGEAPEKGIENADAEGDWEEISEGDAESGKEKTKKRKKGGRKGRLGRRRKGWQRRRKAPREAIGQDDVKVERSELSEKEDESDENHEKVAEKKGTEGDFEENKDKETEENEKKDAPEKEGKDKTEKAGKEVEGEKKEKEESAEPESKKEEKEELENAEGKEFGEGVDKKDEEESKRDPKEKAEAEIREPAEDGKADTTGNKEKDKREDEEKHFEKSKEDEVTGKVGEEKKPEIPVKAENTEEKKSPERDGKKDVKSPENKDNPKDGAGKKEAPKSGAKDKTEETFVTVKGDPNTLKWNTCARTYYAKHTLKEFLDAVTEALPRVCGFDHCFDEKADIDVFVQYRCFTFSVKKTSEHCSEAQVKQAEENGAVVINKETDDALTFTVVPKIGDMTDGNGKLTFKSKAFLPAGSITEDERKKREEKNDAREERTKRFCLFYNERFFKILAEADATKFCGIDDISREIWIEEPVKRLFEKRENYESYGFGKPTSKKIGDKEYLVYRLNKAFADAFKAHRITVDELVYKVSHAIGNKKDRALTDLTNILEGHGSYVLAEGLSRAPGFRYLVPAGMVNAFRGTHEDVFGKPTESDDKGNVVIRARDFRVWKSLSVKKEGLKVCAPSGMWVQKVKEHGYGSYRIPIDRLPQSDYRYDLRPFAGCPGLEYLKEDLKRIPADYTFIIRNDMIEFIPEIHSDYDSDCWIVRGLLRSPEGGTDNDFIAYLKQISAYTKKTCFETLKDTLRAQAKTWLAKNDEALETVLEGIRLLKNDNDTIYYSSFLKEGGIWDRRFHRKEGKHCSFYREQNRTFLLPLCNGKVTPEISERFGECFSALLEIRKCEPEKFKAEEARSFLLHFLCHPGMKFDADTGNADTISKWLTRRLTEDE